MKTYQDLKENQSTVKSLSDFILSAIREHKASDAYKIAADAEEYVKQKNVTISRYRKLLYDLQGNPVPDNWTANHKCASNFFNRFVTQEASYLLGNGVTFEKEDTKAKLGTDFDGVIYKAGKSALVQGATFGFYNLDKVQCFKLTEFVPLYDEENGALRAGIRFWQISEDKPLRATLYEEDGYTEFIKKSDDKNLSIKEAGEKRAYKVNVVSSEADGERIYAGENYPSFPIIVLWGNDNKQSELVGMRENIDCYDLIKSGFANDLDDASMIYWTLENCGGMDDIDLAKFVERMKVLRAAVVDGDGDGGKATAHTLEVPYQSRESYLTRLENDMYNDYMALNVAQMAAGNVTATQITAAYEPMNNKADEFETCVTEFIQGLLRVAGIEDTPTYKRERIANHLEITEMVMSAADVLDDETILNKLPWLTVDDIDGILKRKDAEDSARFAIGVNATSGEGNGTEEE